MWDATFEGTLGHGGVEKVPFQRLKGPSTNGDFMAFNWDFTGFSMVISWSSNGVTPKWMVYNGKSHLEMDDDWGSPYVTKLRHRKTWTYKVIPSSYNLVYPHEL